jgi:hypothetical protein
MPDLEVATAVDLTGDGTIGPAPAPQQRIDTRIGPIVITRAPRASQAASSGHPGVPSLRQGP